MDSKYPFLFSLLFSALALGVAFTYNPQTTLETTLIEAVNGNIADIDANKNDIKTIFAAIEKQANDTAALRTYHSEFENSVENAMKNFEMRIAELEKQKATSPGPVPEPEEPTSDVSVSVDKEFYSPGDIVTISGFGPASTTTKIFILDTTGSQRQVANTLTNSDGEFVAVWLIPQDSEPGQYAAAVQVGSKSGSASFDVK